jgi:hypothetical protein
MLQPWLSGRLREVLSQNAAVLVRHRRTLNTVPSMSDFPCEVIRQVSPHWLRIHCVLTIPTSNFSIIAHIGKCISSTS